MKNSMIFAHLAILTTAVSGQSAFHYDIHIEPVSIVGLPGLHSYVYGQTQSEWILIGGRLDGLHARQPFNAFPANQNNQDVFVINPFSNQVWSASVSSLPTNLREQLQSTNLNFHQDGDTLYIIGGYGFSATANNHITYPFLTTVCVSCLRDSIVANGNLNGLFQQISDTLFEVTGGQLGKIGQSFYLVGGHKFTGRYNPMNNPTFTQAYTNQIRKFDIKHINGAPVLSNVSSITDPIHLRRRDYNLVPQIFPNGQFGYLISSGVFQPQADLPYLYPVEITAHGYQPITQFNQYLSNYHGAKAALYDAAQNNMHSLFFGGISQFYYENGQLVQDNLVPFVKTISRLTRGSDSIYSEFPFPTSMPGFKGASSEFLLNKALPMVAHDVVNLNALSGDTTLLGWVVGGISSPELNPFSSNRTNLTSADDTAYAIYLINTQPGIHVNQIEGQNPYLIKVMPNPASDTFVVETFIRKDAPVWYFLNDLQGRQVDQGKIIPGDTGLFHLEIGFPANLPDGPYSLTLVFEDQFFTNEKVIKKSR
jgi:hypothetical protein